MTPRRYTFGRGLRSQLLAVLACVLVSPLPFAAAESPQGAFFATLGDLCGARFEGEMTFPTEGRDDFAGEVLVAEVEECGGPRATLERRSSSPSRPTPTPPD